MTLLLSRLQVPSRIHSYARAASLAGALILPLASALPAAAQIQTAPAPTAPAQTAPAQTVPAAVPTLAAPLAGAANTPTAAPVDSALGEAVANPLPPVEATNSHAPAAALPHDLSPWGMFLAADIIVKIVMVGLAFASLVTWTVGGAKALELLFAKRSVRASLAKLATAQGLGAENTVVLPRGRVAQFVAAAAGEATRSSGLPAEGTKERAAALLTRLEQRAGRAMTKGTGVLATIGATAPFVGLFGTVWGIMNSFIGISKANTTNLAVVAPGIAEALLATAIGLVAAIPAVVIYNLFARAITSYKALLADASTEVMRHLSRDLDRELYTRGGKGERVVMMRQSAE